MESSSPGKTPLDQHEMSSSFGGSKEKLLRAVNKTIANQTGATEVDVLMKQNQDLRNSVLTLRTRIDYLEKKMRAEKSGKSLAVSMGLAQGSRQTRINRLSSLSINRVSSTGSINAKNQIFSLQKEQLSALVKCLFDNTTAEDVEKHGLPELNNKFGGVDGLLEKLAVDESQGISLNASEVQERQEVFGHNEIPLEPQESLLALMWNALQDPTLIFLCFAALISLVVGVFIEQEPLGWLEGTAILTAVVVVVMVGSINDYQKESQFRELNAKKDNMTVFAIRGGTKVTISCHDLVVGDIVMLSTGDIVSCDGLVLGDNDLRINEKMLTGETVNKAKGAYVIKDGRVTQSPIIFSGTFVQEGEGRMLVLAVGTSTYQGMMEQKMNEAEAEQGRSILQEKLDAMTEVITTGGAFFAALTVLVLCVRMYLDFSKSACCREAWDHHVHWSEVLGYLISGVTIFVVAVPEGLPLAVTIALAFSVKKMLKDQNLVRHLSACETMGGATTICSDKTGTLTTSRMTVMKVYLGGKVHTDIANLDTSDEAKRLLMDSAVINTMSKTRLAAGEGGIAVYTGNDTECGLLVMANTIGAKGAPIDLESEDQEYKRIRTLYPEDAEGRKQFTFSSDRKRMSTRIKNQNGSGFRIYTKGAAEMVLDLCTHWVNPQGKVELLSAETRKSINGIIENFADEALRTICLAMKDCPNAIEDVVEAEKNLTLIGLTGIEDPVRPEVPQAILDCAKAGIVVRMVTGDNMKTAAAIAKKCGIIPADASPEAIAKAALDGKTFREKVQNGDGGLNQEAFDQIWPELRVMGRSTPLDKHLLVSGLQASTHKDYPPQTVAVTGDGTNDAPALKKADVGFAMGIQGTDVAKNASDVIIMDDNFVSIVKAVLWGRCVYDNICKFLQFQLSVNITAIVVACVGAAVLTESPLTAIQMLWVNLIMDSFASLALATEDPNPTLLNRKPYPRNRGVLSKVMMKNMLLHAAWQLVILVGLIFFVGNTCVCPPSEDKTCGGCKDTMPFSHFVGPAGTMPFNVPSGRPRGFDMMAGDSGNCVPVEARPEGYCKKSHGAEDLGSQHYTMVFNVFVLMQLFNEINSRKIHNEANVFDGIFDNLLFVVIIVGTLLSQVALVEVPGLNTAFGCTNLTTDQWLVCLLLSLSELPINLVFRYIPAGLFPGSA